MEVIFKEGMLHLQAVKFGKVSFISIHHSWNKSTVVSYLLVDQKILVTLVVNLMKMFSPI